MHGYILIAMNIGKPAAQVATSGEIPALEEIKRKMGGHPSVLFDVGANEGDYTEALLSVFGARAARIYAFEPVRETFGRLSDRFSGNTNVMLQRLALGKKGEEKMMYAADNETGLTSMYKQDVEHRGIHLKQKEEVSVETLDDFCSREHIEHIDFMKLDVEGCEYDVLLGAQKMLAQKRISYIQFEFGRTNLAARTYLKDFFDILGKEFRFYRIVKDGLVPIRYDERYEIFYTTNFVAERIS